MAHEAVLLGKCLRTTCVTRGNGLQHDTGTDTRRVNDRGRRDARSAKTANPHEKILSSLPLPTRSRRRSPASVAGMIPP
jgi:hypothetical protein